jgi:molybdate transport system substrate-binding protein
VVLHAPLYIRVYCDLVPKDWIIVRISVTQKLIAATVFVMASSLARAGDLHVSAAASLTNAFKEIADRYQGQHADTRVLLNFGASGALLQQIAKGAPVDVFAAADQETMDTAASRHLIVPAHRRDFVRNTLVVIVPADSKLTLRKLGDLRQPAMHRMAVGNPASVPVGRYARDALVAGKLWDELGPRMVLAQNVRQALDYVARGETDAGFVYGTDVAAARGQVKVALQVPLDKPIAYPIALTSTGADKDEAYRFVAYVLSPEAQAVLARYGFSRP